MEVTSGITNAMFTVNGIVYTKHYKVDSRYSKMDPIVCFIPNVVSAAPSKSPTSSPTVSSLAVVQAVQVPFLFTDTAFVVVYIFPCEAIHILKSIIFDAFFIVIFFCFLLTAYQWYFSRHSK